MVKGVYRQRRVDITFRYPYPIRIRENCEYPQIFIRGYNPRTSGHIGAILRMPHYTAGTVPRDLF